MFRKFTTVFAFLFLVASTNVALAFEEINTGYFNDTALHGFDSAGYHTSGKALEGTGDLVYKWKGAEWRFATKESRDLFASNPEKYSPQFGGYCSNQMSLGNLHDIDPGVWLIHKEKLYFFGHQVGKDRWLRTGVDARIQDAEKNWKKYLAQKN